MVNARARSAVPNGAAIFVVAVALGAACPLAARADDAAAKGMLKAMSDYLAAQKSISFTYDTDFEVVTKDHQKIALASSGTIELSRPDKVRAERTGGFADVEIVFDGKTLTLLGKNANMYAQAEMPGTVDQLIDTLRDKLHRPIPGADLLGSNVYDALMPEVTDAKDLGSGVIGGIECDHLAFRTDEVDWQIWIAQGANPYPCRYVVTSRKVDQAPQYSIEIRDWKAGGDVAAATSASPTRQTPSRSMPIRSPSSAICPSISRLEKGNDHADETEESAADRNHRPDRSGGDRMDVHAFLVEPRFSGRSQGRPPAYARQRRRRGKAHGAPVRGRCVLLLT